MSDMAESHKPCQQSLEAVAGLPPPRLLRSPSHESVSTELSLFSISSAASEMSRAGLRVVLPPHLARGPSPTPETRHRLQVSSQVSPNIYYPLPSVTVTAFAVSIRLYRFLCRFLSVPLAASCCAVRSGHCCCSCC